MVDGVGAGGISPKDLYNKVQGSKTEFVKQWQAEYKGNPFMAEKIYNYVASMDSDGTPGLTPEEYKQGLNDKKALAEIKLDKIYEQYVAKEDIEDFVKMNQDEKLSYLEGRIPHEPGREAEAHIQASIVLSSLNRLDTEMTLIDQELLGMELEENPDALNEIKTKDGDEKQFLEHSMKKEQNQDLQKTQQETIKEMQNQLKEEQNKQRINNKFYGLS